MGDTCMNENNHREALMQDALGLHVRVCGYPDMHPVPPEVSETKSMSSVRLNAWVEEDPFPSSGTNCSSDKYLLTRRFPTKAFLFESTLA